MAGWEVRRLCSGGGGGVLKKSSMKMPNRVGDFDLI